MRFAFHQSPGYPSHDVSVIPPSRRLAVIPHFFFGALACLGAWIDRASYRQTVYDSLFEYIPLEVWAIGFGLAAFAAGVTMVTGLFRAYVIANLAMLFLSCSWFIALLKTRFIDNEQVTPLGFGLWMFVVLTCLVNAAIPTTVITVRGRVEQR